MAVNYFEKSNLNLSLFSDDKMTLTCEPDLDIVKNINTSVPKVKFLGQGFQKFEHKQDRHTHTDAHRHGQTRKNACHATFTGGISVRYRLSSLHKATMQWCPARN